MPLKTGISSMPFALHPQQNAVVSADSELAILRIRCRAPLFSVHFALASQMRLSGVKAGTQH
jgi:hypothetical protein